MKSEKCKAKLNELKMEAAKEIGMEQNIKENHDHDRGNALTKVNGAQSGPIGGQMVKMIIQEEKKKINGSQKEENYENPKF